MSTAYTIPMVSPANDVGPGEDERSLMVVEEAAPLRLPAADSVGFNSGHGGIPATGTEHRWWDV